MERIPVVDDLKMKIIRAYLVVDCPMGGVMRFELCKKCRHNDYVALTEYAVECTFPAVAPSREIEEELNVGSAVSYR